jgi:hypothetical protein
MSQGYPGTVGAALGEDCGVTSWCDAGLWCGDNGTCVSCATHEMRFGSALTGYECTAVCKPGEYAFEFGSQYGAEGGCKGHKRGTSDTWYKNQRSGGCCSPGDVPLGGACEGVTNTNPAGNCAGNQPCIAGFCGGAQAASPVAACAASGGTWNGTTCVMTSSPPPDQPPPQDQQCGVHSHFDSGQCYCDDGYTWASSTGNDCKKAATTPAKTTTPPEYVCGVHSSSDSSGICHCDAGYTWVSATSNDCAPPMPGTPPRLWPWVAGAFGLAAAIGGGIYLAKRKK